MNRTMPIQTSASEILNGTIIHTYDWYDGPLNYTLLGQSGQLYYATLCDIRFGEGHKFYDYLYFPTTQEKVEALLNGDCTIRDFHVASSVDGAFVDSSDGVTFHTQAALFAAYPVDEWSAEVGRRFKR